MGLLNGVWLADGSYLTVMLAPNIGGPTDRRSWAMLEAPDGSRSAWECLDVVRQFTSMPEIHGTSGSKVIIDALSTPPSGEVVDDLADFWVPYRNVYVHDTLKPFARRFSGWKVLGTNATRSRPTIPPLP